MLVIEGEVVNSKRTCRSYCEEGLQVRTKKRKKVLRSRVPMLVPDAVNQRWSMDFVSDQLANGRRFRALNVVDDFSREYELKVVDFSISGHRVARELDRIHRQEAAKDYRLRQRPRVHVEGHVLLGEEGRCEAALHPAGQANAECVRRKLQRQETACGVREGGGLIC
jgi:hypothetical protein